MKELRRQAYFLLRYLAYRIRAYLRERWHLAIGGERVAGCAHLAAMRDASPRTPGCQECLQCGDSWVHLRLCESCGHVGCCDSSRNRHASRHFRTTGHPVIRSFQPGEAWRYCYLDEEMVE